MFNLKQWKQTFLTQEQAQTNRFEIMINLPKVLSGSSEAARYVSLRCENVNFEFYGEDSSCIIKEQNSENDVYVIMPMRL